MTVEVGIIGTGTMGQSHARLIATQVPGARVAAVCDLDAVAARRLADRHGIEVVHQEARALIADPRVQAVIVAASDAVHADCVLAAIEAGKRVLTEKPLASDAEGCARIVAAEAATGQPLVEVAYMRRFDPGYLALRAAVMEGRLGAPLLMHCRHRNARAPHFITAHSVLTNALVHEIDALRFVLGTEVSRVRVLSGRASRHAPDRPPMLAVLETEAGVTVDVELFLDARYGYDVRAELVFEDGTLSLNPEPPTHLRTEGRDGIEVDDFWHRRFADAYQGQLRAWVEGVASNRLTGATAMDGYVATLVAEAALAAWTKSEVVATPLPRKARTDVIQTLADTPQDHARSLRLRSCPPR